MKCYLLLIQVYFIKLSRSSCPASLAGIPTEDQYGRPTCAIQYTGMGDPLPEYGCNGCMENDLNGFYIHSGAVRQAISKKFLPFGSTVIFERCQLHLFEVRFRCPKSLSWKIRAEMPKVRQGKIIRGGFTI